MAAESKYVTLTGHNFEAEVLQSAEPVLVDFWADWCAPCHRIAPVIEELARKFEGRAKVAKLNVDEHSELARRFGIRSIPSLLFFRDGAVVDQVVGVAPAETVAEKLDALVATA